MIDTDSRIETFASFLPSLLNQDPNLGNGAENNQHQSPDGRKMPRDVLDLFIKLMKNNDCTINQIMSDTQQVSFGVKHYFERAERHVLYNASSQMKTQLMRNLVYESDLYINGSRVNSTKDMTLPIRFELYILCEFYRCTEAGDI